MQEIKHVLLFSLTVSNFSVSTMACASRAPADPQDPQLHHSLCSSFSHSHLYLQSHNTDPAYSLSWSFPIAVPCKPLNAVDYKHRAEGRNCEEEMYILPGISIAFVAEPKLRKLTVLYTSKV